MYPRRGQENFSEGSLLDDKQFLRRVAMSYYESKYRQEEIATMEHCSRQTIGKALQRAKELGMVRITVVPEERSGYIKNLSRELRNKLKLNDLELVTGQNLELLAANEVAEDVLEEVSLTAANYLDQCLENDDILAVSGGRHIMRRVVRYLKPSKLLPQLQVVPTTGFVQLHTNYGDPNLIAYDIATAYGAKHAWLPLPALAESAEQCEQARSLPLARDVLNMMERATVVIQGLWIPYRPDLVQRKVLSQEQIDQLMSYHPVLDLNHWSFDKDGQCINYMISPPLYYPTGFEIPRLKEKVSNSGIKSILVAGGSRSHAIAIRAALKAGIANILITDHVTAEMLLHDELW